MEKLDAGVAGAVVFADGPDGGDDAGNLSPRIARILADCSLVR